MVALVIIKMEGVEVERHIWKVESLDKIMDRMWAVKKKRMVKTSCQNIGLRTQVDRLAIN